MTAEPRAVTLRWQKMYRIVASRHPPVNVFENILPPQQRELGYFIEGLTNDRLRDESGEAPVMPDEDQGAWAGRHHRDGSVHSHWISQPIQRWQLRRLLRRAHAGNRRARDCLPSRDIHGVDQRESVRSRHACLREPAGAAVPGCSQSALPASASSGRLRSLAVIRKTFARPGRMGAGVSQRSPRRRRMYRGVQAAGREHSGRRRGARLCVGRRRTSARSTKSPKCCSISPRRQPQR